MVKTCEDRRTEAQKEVAQHNEWRRTGDEEVIGGEQLTLMGVFSR